MRIMKKCPVCKGSHTFECPKGVLILRLLDKPKGK